MRVAPAGTGTVDTQAQGIGKFPVQGFLETLGAEALWLQRKRSAIRTGRRFGFAVTAVMALQASQAFVQSQRGITARA